METLTVKAGNVTIGGEAPIVVQTMCNTHTSDVEASVAQCVRLHEAGGGLSLYLAMSGERASLVPAIT